MRQILMSGTLEHLEELRVEEYGPGGLTTEALEMLLEHCSHLKSIGNLRTCCSLDLHFIRKLERRLLVQNLDLEVIW
jgi:hypothetical protein